MGFYFYLCKISLVLFLLNACECAQNDCELSNAKSCSECMAIPGCAWCEHPEYANNPNLIIARCNLPEILESEGCPLNKTINPKSTLDIDLDNPHSNVGESDVGKATQLRPQEFTANLRPGEPVDIKISYKQAEDYPVDLYYLLDLSYSMKDDLDSLRLLGKQLGDNMARITRDFRLGFGSFVDKTVMPYISMVPSKLANPCTDQSPCVPAYSYSNDLPLTSNLDAFTNSVNKVNYSSNLDAPEGGFDAMMQAIVCVDNVNWRRDATHLLVFSTDAAFHYAGDGKLGGIVIPNDGNCYLDNRRRYTKANEMDYPSIGHLVQKISDYNIQPIFAVTKTVIETYTKLKDMIPKATVGALTSNSSNIIGLIEEAYEDLRGQVVLNVNPPEGIVVTGQQSACANGEVKEGVLECDNVKIGDTVEFTLSIMATKCFDEPIEMDVPIVGYSEKVKINIVSKCECDCSVPDKASNCSGNGMYKCGACICEEGFLGLDCSCDKKDIVGVESYLKNCTQSEGEPVCSDRGECLCGVCVCSQYSDRRVYEKYCQCDDASCDRVNGKKCNGHGSCDCGECLCDEGWKGKACECTKDQSTCIDPAKENGVACEGAGECLCGSCKCNVTKNGLEYRGTYCEISPSQLCEIHKECVLCNAYEMGNETACNEQCTQYQVKKLEKTASQLRSTCRVIDADDCSVTFYFEKQGNIIYVETDTSTRVCPKYTNPMIFIIVIIAAIVGIGLAILLIWKLWTSIKDAQQYKQWQKEVQNAKWDAGENPIYKPATSTHANPIYGAKPTSQL